MSAASTTTITVAMDQIVSVTTTIYPLVAIMPFCSSGDAMMRRSHHRHPAWPQEHGGPKHCPSGMSAMYSTRHWRTPAMLTAPCTRLGSLGIGGEVAGGDACGRLLQVAGQQSLASQGFSQLVRTLSCTS
jgi:hypothetical protein